MPRRLARLDEARPLLDIASYGRRGPADGGRLSAPELDLIRRTVARTPEVVVKVSGGGRSARAVAAHVGYIGRHGELEIETDDGERLRGRADTEALIEDWDLDLEPREPRGQRTGSGIRGPAKLVHNLVFSMPAATSPDKLLAAVRDFAREEFALKHRYALVLHTDQDHPHVHMIVKAVSEQGMRLNIRKATLRRWRAEFARQLRERGVAANATERAVRGRVGLRLNDGIYRATLRGASEHLRRRTEEVAGELVAGRLRVEPGKSKLLATRRDVEHGWRAAVAILDQAGQADVAAAARAFLERLPYARTEKEWIAEQLRARHQTRQRDDLALVR